MNRWAQAFGRTRGPLVAVAVFFGFWSFVVLAFAAQLVFRASFEWDRAIRTSLLDWLPWVVLSPGVWWLARRFPMERGVLRWNVPLQLASCLVSVTACGWMADVLADRWLAPSPPPGVGQMPFEDRGPGAAPRPWGEPRRVPREFDMPPPPDGMDDPARARRDGRGGQGFRPGGPDRGPRRFFTAVIIARSRVNLPVFWVIVSVAHAFAFYRRVEERDRRALELAASLSQAKLQALRLQLQPHFLFNTLNAIATLVHTNPDAADEMITNLSEMLRLSLDVTDQEVPLRQELELLDRYLEIEQVRLGDRLRVTREIDADLLSALVPALMLQTLVENAIRHGIEPRREPGTVTLRATRAGDVVRLTVADDGVGFKPADQRTERQGIGLANTEARLRELYGPAGRVVLQQPAEGGVRVEIELPWHLAPVVAGSAGRIDA